MAQTPCTCTHLLKRLQVIFFLLLYRCYYNLLIVRFIAPLTLVSVLSGYPVVRAIDVEIEMPRALLLADAACVRLRRGRGHAVDLVKIQNLALTAVIGLNACERLDKQKLYCISLIYSAAYHSSL